MVEQCSPLRFRRLADFLHALEIFREEGRHAPPLAAQVVLDVSVIALAGQHHQVRGVVVGAVAVPVVHDLARQEGTPEQLFSQQSVGQKSSARALVTAVGVLLPALDRLPSSVQGQCRRLMTAATTSGSSKLASRASAS